MDAVRHIRLESLFGLKQKLKSILKPLYVIVVRKWRQWRLTPLYRKPVASQPIDQHLKESVAWLIRAHDHGPDAGVSYGTMFGEGFDPLSYPETTGYIIPTFIRLADYYKDESFLKRAIAMGDWEIDIQLDCGAVMGGKYHQESSPAVFNTGQVLLGWSALYQQTGESRFAEAAAKAVDWMLSLQESSGNWLAGNSVYCNSEATLYNVKAAWGLAEAGKILSNQKAITGAIRNAEYCINKQHNNGWFADCCLTDANNPLLHTQAYAMQGLIGVGILTGQDRFIQAACKTADSLILCMGDDGYLPGRFDSRFNGSVNWCCLTGSAQTAISWARLYQLTADKRYFNACIKANQYLMAHHDIDNNDDSIRGGVPGSWPVSGEYGQYCILNWATNFFVESLLEQLCMNRSPISVDSQ